MATKKKLLQAAAGSATGGGGLDVDEVFSTYLYTGTNDDGPNFAQTITNGIDLAGEGGLVWTKARDFSVNHALVDTVRGNTKYLESDTNDDDSITSVGITAFNSDGYDLGADNTWKFNVNNAYVSEYVSWTFRKAPKFFDLVTWTGNDADGDRAFSHSLDSVPGMIIIKKRSADTNYMDWYVHHRSGPSGKFGKLNSTSAWDDDDGDAGYSGIFGETAPSSTQFYASTQANQAGYNYVAYLFAHNDGDGEFGPSGDQDIIKCGSYTGNGSTDGPEIDLGFEPQFIITKRTDGTGNWLMFDSMRGIATGGNDAVLSPNRSWDETVTVGDYVDLQSTGFKLTNTSSTVNESAASYIYIAIRRGPLAPPESATEVFDVEFGSASPKPWFKSGFPVDFGFFKNRDATGNWQSGSRLTQGTSLNPNLTNAEEAAPSTKFDYQNGWYNSFGASTSWLSWMWKRAPGYFDALCYSGNSTAGRTVSHNLGVAPEMMWVKRRNAVDSWAVFLPSILGNTKALVLDQTLASFTYDGFNNTDPSDTAFTLGNDSSVNASGSTYIAYLFASLPGISKVGSYVGNGSSSGPTVDCGFSGSPRFVLIKKATGGTGSWYVFDSVRGIVAGSESQLYLNNTAAEQTATDQIDPTSSGFQIVINSGGLNTNGETYIFYAIA